MKILIFFSRIALICNICFIIVVLMRYTRALQLNPLFSTIVVLGHIAIWLNILIALGVLTGVFMKKPVWNSSHRWLLIINFLFLIAQLFIFLS